jgi:hypothetical protein
MTPPWPSGSKHGITVAAGRTDSRTGARTDERSVRRLEATAAECVSPCGVVNRVTIVLVGAAIAVALGLASTAQAAPAAPPVSPHTLDQCFNEHGGSVRDDLLVGTPCAPFQNRARVLAYVKALLLYNGFRPSMTVTKVWARQIGIDEIQDGIKYGALLVKSGGGRSRSSSARRRVRVLARLSVQRALRRLAAK